MFKSAVAFAFLVPAGIVNAICPGNYTNLYNGMCFHFYMDVLVNYDQAQAKCAADGGQLASIHSQEESDIMFAAMPKVSDAWIGLICTTDFQPYWADGTPFDYQHFYNTDCTASMAGLFLVQPENVGKWYWWNKVDVKWYTLCTIKQEVPTGPCELNYSYQEELGMCIRVNPSSTSWNDAESSCQADNAHLVSIHSQESNSFIRRFALSNQLDESIFIGLRLTSHSDGVPTASWSDNSTLDYRNFNQGMPNADLGECMAMETRTVVGDWISVHCDSLTKLPYLCSKAPPCPTANTFFYEGDIYSPNYPSSSSRAVNCEYFIVAHNKTSVLIQFDEVSLVNDDQIILYDGAETLSSMAVVRGDSVGKKYMTTNDNVLRLVYQTGTTIGNRSWHARFSYF